MIKYKAKLKNDMEVNCCGGEGKADIFKVVSPSEVYPEFAAYALVHLDEGDTVGYHVHTDDMEMYTLIKGKAIYNDNGEEVILNEGDTSVTYKGEGHGIKPCDGPLDFLACTLKPR